MTSIPIASRPAPEEPTLVNTLVFNGQALTFAGETVTFT